MSRADRWKSDSQANAESLTRRASPYSGAYVESVTTSWDYQKRAPRDLRDAVRIARQAYADETPLRMHNQDLADDGTPKMTPQAEGLIFGSPTRTDAGHDPEDRPLLSYYQTPFRATLANMKNGDMARRMHALIVQYVTIETMDAVDAARRCGVPVWCAGSVAEIALRSFLGRLTDVRVDLANEGRVA